MIWTPQIDTKIDNLVAGGLSLSKIARYLARSHPGCTKNAIVGRRWRRRRRGEIREPFSMFAGEPKFTPRTNAPWRRLG